ncbi:MAG: efflux RND transporter periplasmic adaptor subunit, partial [Rikenellaceae bacterium]
MNSKILSIILPLAIIGCKQNSTKPQIPPPVVEVVSVEQAMIANNMEFIGEVSSNYDAIIQPRIEGYLTEINYSDGMPVKKGDILYKIDPNTIEMDVAAALASVESAKALLIEAQNNYNRAVPLAKIDAISQSSLDEYEASYKSAQASLKSAQAQLNSSEIDLGYTIITSPIDGIIGYADLVVGQYVGPSSANSQLNTVSNIDSIRVAISIPLSTYLTAIDADSIDVNAFDNSQLLQDISLFMADGTKYPYKGEYLYTKKSVTSSTGSIVIVVGFENPDWLLKIGQYVKIKSDIGKKSNKLLVPQVSVKQSQGVNSVWVIDKDS